VRLVTPGENLQSSAWPRHLFFSCSDHRSDPPRSPSLVLVFMSGRAARHKI
jgi:hypothetical protein